jgi:hypothetical protein
VKRLVLSLSTLLALSRVGSNLLVIALKRSQVLTSLGELTLLHTLTDVPVDEGTLAVHEVELVGECGPSLGDGRGVGQHADGAVDLGEVAVGDHLWWLVADTDLETSWAPVDELDGALGLERGNSLVNNLGNDVSTVKQAGGHVLAVARVALDHLAVWLEAGHADLLHAVGLVGSLGGRNDWRIGDQREVDTWVWDQVGLELVQVDVEGAVEAKRCGDGGDNLGDQTVQVLEVGALNTEVAAADVVDGLIVDHEGAVAVLEGGVSGKDGVVWLDDRGGDLWGWVDTEFQLALLAVVNRQTFHEESTETRAGTTTEAVEDEETLETRAVVGNMSDLVEDLVNELLADGVVTTGVVVRGILLASDHLLWVEETAVWAGADLVDDVGLEIAVDGAWHVLAVACEVLDFARCCIGAPKRTGLGEEGRESMVVVGGLALLGEVAVGLQCESAERYLRWV